MKRIIFLILLFLGLTQWAGAQTADKHFEIDVMGGAGLSSFSGTEGAIGGPDGEIEGYYLLDHHLGIGASIGYGEVYFRGVNSTYVNGGYSGVETNYTFGFLDFLAVAKYRLLKVDDIQPYLIGGVGICDNITTLSSSAFNGNNQTPYVAATSASIYPEISGGFGFEIYLFPDMNVFAQSKYNLILSNNGSTFFIPLDAGLNLLL